MNLLIFDPSHKGRHFVFQALKRRFNWIVCVKSIRELFTQLPPFAHPFSLIILIVPAVRIRRDGTVVPRSRRAEIILQIAHAAEYARVNTVILPQTELPVAFFDKKTGRALSGAEIFFRPIDPTTNTFRGCLVDRDWEQILKSAMEK